MTTRNLFCVKDKIVFVSGASSGIGLHLARTLAQAGAAVALAARRKEHTDTAAAQLAGSGNRVCSVYLDVTKAETIAAAFDSAEQALGGPVDVLLNSAGILYAKEFLKQDASEIDRIFETNLKGSLLVAQEAARRMARLNRGSIINVASTAGLRAGGLLSSYAASKAGVIHLTKVMALELAGKGIRVNVLCPGNFETDMHKTFAEHGLEERLLSRIPQRRFGKLEYLDGAVLLLASDAGSYMTGVVLTVDGGQCLSWM